MACKVRYLCSAGIHHREVKGVEALAKAFPISWLIYASLNAFPKNSAPIEIDVMVVMDDRIVLLELKDWNGPLKAKGDMWVHGKSQRSPVVLGNEKAKKIKGMLKNQIPQVGKCYVDSRVVLTGTSTRDLLSDAEKPYVLTLEEAKLLGDKKHRDKLLGTVTFTQIKPNMFVKDFERVIGNGSYFQPLKMSWDGYNVTDEDFFVHRKDIWREHRAQLSREERVKAMLRLFRFDNLPVGLNEPGGRQLIADRELKTVAYLGEHDSWMAEKGILKQVGTSPAEILTEHYQLLAIPTGWTTLRRYLQRNGAELQGEQLVDIMHSLASMVAELHDRGVAHRDIGDDSIWLSSPTSMALTGFYSATLPDDQSVSDYLEILGTYSEPEPNWDGVAPTAKQRDVRSLGLLMHELSNLDSGKNAFPEGWYDLANKATASPDERYADARLLADALGELRTPSGPTVDQSLLDEFETPIIPYVLFQPLGQPSVGGHSTRYESAYHGEKVVVKVWNGLLRGDARRDHSLLAMLEAAASLKALPEAGIVSVVASGLSPIGPFVVMRWVEGVALKKYDAPDETSFLTVMGNLVLAVNSLHARGLAHGDLHPDNVIVSSDLSVTLIDLMDISPIGTGRVRSAAWVPEDHERRSDEQIDRFSVCRIVSTMAQTAKDFPLPAVVKAANEELDRLVIETLDPLWDSISLELKRIEEPPTKSFVLRFPAIEKTSFSGDGGHLWVTAHRTPAGLDVFWITGLNARLLLRMRDDDVDGVELGPVNFNQLGKGERLKLELSVEPGIEAGCVDLARYLRELVSPDVPEVIDLVAPDWEGEAEDASEEIETESEIISINSSASLDISGIWLRAAEIEEDSILRVRLDRRMPDQGNSASYEYETARPLEFEDEDTVEVRLGGLSGRLIGYLDVPNCDIRRLAIRDLRSPVAPGEFVSLIDRRDRVSKERRRRAVERITRRKSVIRGLIDYFDPTFDAPELRFDLSISDQELSDYKLNDGQRASFRSLLEVGPIGLLQGPPGSGKTKFIASLAHWLLRKGGARRVLVASQSHEAVNNVLEELLKTYRIQGGHADLLRVGSRGATERVRPYQARSLRDRYRVRFENGLKTRVAHAASAVGISRQFVHDVVNVDLKLGSLQRAIELAGVASIADAVRDERRRSITRMRTLTRAFTREASQFVGRELQEDDVAVTALLEEAYTAVLSRHPKVPRGDLATVRQLVSLANEWKETLSSGHRNFDEFLAKTRRVVAGTCVGLGQSQIRLEQGTFDWVIVDEAARCTSGELAVPLQLGSRVVLVGDQRQLRPMVERAVQKALQDEFSGAGKALAQSDFERAFESSYGRRNAQVLDEQYRMVPVISDLVSDTFYAPHGVKLKPSPDREADPAFAGLKGDLAAPVVWFDTSQMLAAQERDRNDGRDIWNDAEIATVISILHRLSREEPLTDALAKRSEPAIGVICMYSEQKRRLQREWSQQPFAEGFRRSVVIDTVDAYQGKENEIVIVTLVRSNDLKAPGHVGRENRCNVAMSRAKERLYIVGDTTMWSSPKCHSPMRTVLSRLKDMDKNSGDVRPAGDIGQ
ncbi:AAA domain-containing protein [Rhizobium laguerreae]|uniref:AAA domain-containing protein n=1 Tax=Rhizobium laguerreae TaxID=1076926 RepID=UPI001C925058|nr:AAA domain-containing protein [Rhizobium laguerreae]MBY3201771.1 AAA family ATPase [Rhizobium laguerreae]